MAAPVTHTRTVRLVLFLTACSGLTLAATAREPRTPPNVILFLADDMGVGDTSAWQDWTGNDDSVQLSTPALERLARSGVRFTDAHAPHSRCTTTRYALLYFASPANHSPYTPSSQLGDIAVRGASQFVDGRPCNSRRRDFVFQNDVHVHRLLEFLRGTDDPRRSGHPLSENTLFVFASDNGAERANPVFTGPLRSNKGSVYEGGHRIPLIIGWPLGGIGDGDATTPGRTIADLIGLNDLYATLAEILQRPLPPTDGSSVGA